MRGSPPVQIALLLVGFIALGAMLVRLTAARGPAVPPPVVAMAKGADNKLHTLVRLRFAHAPTQMSLKAGTQELLSAPVKESPAEVEAELVLPRDGLELQFAAQWPDGTPATAVTVELEPDGLDRREQTRWTDTARLEEPLLFQWKL